MLELELRELLARGHEQSGVEFKGSRPRSDRLFAAKVVRACLGMANRRDGGYVILGVDDDGKGRITQTGLAPKDAPTWNGNDLADTLAEYADPSVTFDVDEVMLDGLILVVIRVHEFTDVPVLCKKDYKEILRKGACYVRPRRKPETVEIPTQEDMRDILDLATDKKVQRFVSQAVNAGLLPSGPSGPSDEDRYSQQLGNLVRR